MGLLNKLGLYSDIQPVFTSPTRREKWFTKYKGGRVDFVLDKRFEEPGGFDWLVIDDERLFEKFVKLQTLADETRDRGNEVKFRWSFCDFSVKFLNTSEAVWFRMKL